MEKAPYKRQQQYAENCVLNFNLAKDIKIYNSEPLFLGKYKAAFEKLLSIQVRKNRYNTFISLVKTLLNALLNGGTYIFLILKYSFGLVSISSFSMYLASVAEFYGAIDAVFFMFIDFYETNINLEEFEKNLSHRETLISRGNLSVNSVDSIEFKNVTFTYPGQSKPALDNVSFFIGKNEKVLLVGENGAGKTTIVKLLLRLYDVDKGEITVNGINIMDIRYDDYIKLMSPVFQDVKLFAYSVKENIILNKAFDSDRMNGSLDAIGIRGQIENTPRGIETCNTKEFDESGINFSGGEIQKIAIAKALYQGGEVLIMDEPNSALDSLSERDLINNIKLISKDKMSIFISHRLSLSKTCDKIIVMNNGEVEEIGSHRELLKSHGLYYSLFSMQASKYTDSEQ